VGYLTRDTGEIAVEQWKEVVRAHADNESITVLLIHPSDSRDDDYKLTAQRELMVYARDLNAWIGSIGAFGDFWRARHELQILDVRVDDTGGSGGHVLELRLSPPGPVIHPSIGLVVPGGARYAGFRVLDAAGNELPFERRDTETKVFLNIRESVDPSVW